MRLKQRRCHQDPVMYGVSVDSGSKQDVYGYKEGISGRLRRGPETRAPVNSSVISYFDCNASSSPFLGVRSRLSLIARSLDTLAQ
jgi:hypothetical protein